MRGTDRPPHRTALVVLALVGLLAAAVALPASVGPWSGERTVTLDEDEDSATEPGDGPGVFIRPPLELIEILFRLLGLIEVETPDGPPSPAYNVSVQPEPTPGRVVTVTVTRRGEPVEGALVAFNGRPIGRTDAQGRVSGEVPYDRELVVTVTPPGVVEPTSSGTERGRASTGVARVPLVQTRAFPVAWSLGGRAPSPFPRQASGTPNGTPENASESFVIDDPVRLRISGRPDPGGTVDLAASIAGVPMRDARVTVNGEEVGRTDDEGRYTLYVPDDGTEELQVRVVRGDFAGAETIDVRLLAASIEPHDFVAVPGRPATVTATIADEPASGAVVELDGRQLGTTGSEGGLRFVLPSDPGATITVRTADQSVTEGFLGLYAATGGLLLAVMAAVGAVVAVVRRRAALPDDLGRVASNALDRVIRAALRAAVWVADRLQWLIRRAGRVLRATWRSGVGLARRLLGLLRGGLEGVAHELRGLPRRVLAFAYSVAGWLRSAPGRLLAWYRSRNRTAAPPRATPWATPTGSPEEPDLPELWRTFARWVVPGDWPRRTPGEVARTAIDRGFPAGAVDTVTSAFRDAEYGGEAISDERLGRVREAFERLVDRRIEGDGRGPEGGGRP